MNSETGSSCRCATTAVAYASDDLSPPEMLEFEMHLSECEECCEHVRQMRQVRSLFGEFAFLRDLVSAGKRDPARARIEEALLMEAHGLESQPSIQKRFAEWSRELGQIAAETFRQLVHPAESSLSLAGAGIARVLKSNGLIWEADIPLPSLGPDIQVRGAGRSNRWSKSPVKALEMNYHWVNGQDIEVSIIGLPSLARAPFVLLVPTHKDLTHRRRAQLKQDSNNRQRWGARFENVEAGSYMIVLERLQEQS